MWNTIDRFMTDLHNTIFGNADPPEHGHENVICHFKETKPCAMWWVGE
jgi:hypothetical protein